MIDSGRIHLHVGIWTHRIDCSILDSLLALVEPCVCLTDILGTTIDLRAASHGNRHGVRAEFERLIFSLVAVADVGRTSVQV